MIVRIALLFFTVSICHGNEYRPQFTQMQPTFHRNTQQGDGIRYYPNPQSYVNQQPQHLYQPHQQLNQPQQYVNQYQPQGSAEHSFNKPTSLSTPFLPPVLVPRNSFIPAGYAYSRDNRVSDRECYEKYVPESPPAGIGGELAKYGEFLYMAAIGYNREGGGYDYQCGGTLLSYYFVLTAAHCRSVRGQLAAVVKPGGVRLDDESRIHEPIEIKDIIVHPNYKRKQIYNDIALLKLKDINYGIVACLWTKDYINYNTATALGYGQTDTRLSTSNDLYKIDLQLYSSQVCKAYYTPRFRIEKGLIDSQFCAGDFNRVRDTCVGDSGGPLLIKMNVNNTEIPFILGITSFGPGCGAGIPGIYTKVSSYLDWIEPIVWPEG